MKKTVIYREPENEILYTGISALYGGWLLSTSGNPLTLNVLEDADGCEGALAEINAILEDPRTPWEVCTAADEDYINEWLNIWGIKEE